MRTNKFFSKVIGTLLASVMLSSSIAYASTNNTYTVYDNNGTSYTLDDGEVLGVLYDKYGNVKEQSMISMRNTYVNGSYRTLEPGDYFITYQYEPSVRFFAGFNYIYGNNTTPATTPGGKLKITLQNSETIGGSRNNITSRVYDTTYDEGDGTSVDGGTCEMLLTEWIDPDKPYYNARFENVGSKTITVCWLVGMD